LTKVRIRDPIVKPPDISELAENRETFRDLTRLLPAQQRKLVSIKISK